MLLEFRDWEQNILLDSTCRRRWQISELPGQILIFVCLQTPSSFDLRTGHIPWPIFWVVLGPLAADFETWFLSDNSSVPQEFVEVSFEIFFPRTCPGALTQDSITPLVIARFPASHFVVSAVRWFAKHSLGHCCWGDRASSLVQSKVSNKALPAPFLLISRPQARARSTWWTRGQPVSMQSLHIIPWICKGSSRVPSNDYLKFGVDKQLHGV